jgi:hypothetical protein
LILFNIKKKKKLLQLPFICIGGGWGIKVQLAEKNTLLQLPEERFVYNEAIHCKKRFATFPSPAGMSLTKLSLVGII